MTISKAGGIITTRFILDSISLTATIGETSIDFGLPTDLGKKGSALTSLLEKEECKDKMDPEAIQTIVYSVGKDNGYQENLREWFKAIYEIIFGDQNGPRMGFFISFFGVKVSIELIKKYIK